MAELRRAWSTNDPSATTLIGRVRDILNGPLVSELNQYGVMTATLVPRVDFVPGKFGKNPSNNLPYTFTTDMVTMLRQEMDAHRVPLPNAALDRFYFVFLPNDVYVGDPGYGLSVGGAHPASTYNGTPFYYGFARNKYVKPYYPSAGVGAGVFSHEFVEASTDPDGTTGWRIDGTSSDLKNSEVNDICCNQYAVLHNNDYASNTFWSQRAGKCVMPSTWSSIWGYTGSGTTWLPLPATPTPLHQVASGSYALAGADEYNDVWIALTGQPWTRVKPITYPSMLTVTAESVYMLDYQNKIYRFDGSSGWKDISIPNVTPSGIYGGDFGLFATDITGTAWHYNGVAAGTWTAIMPGVSQVAISKKVVYFLSEDHSVLAYSANLAAGFTFAAINVGDIYAGPGGFAYTDLATHFVLWYDEKLTITWQSGPAYNVAITGTPTTPALFGLTPDRFAIFQSTNLAQSFPPWNLVGPAATRLIGGGPWLLAPADVSFATQIF